MGEARALSFSVNQRERERERESEKECEQKPRRERKGAVLSLHPSLSLLLFSSATSPQRRYLPPSLSQFPWRRLSFGRFFSFVSSFRSEQLQEGKKWKPKERRKKNPDFHLSFLFSFCFLSFSSSWLTRAHRRTSTSGTPAPRAPSRGMASPPPGRGRWGRKARRERRA